MRGSIGIAIMVSACYHPTPATGVPCSPSHDCPGLQICDVSQLVPTCVDSLIDGGSFALDGTLIDASDASIDARPIDAPTARMIPPGAALWLKLDDDPLDGATDSAGTHTTTCASCAVLVAGRIESAYQFTTDRLDVAAATDLQPGTAFTIAAWVRLDATPTVNSAVACKGFSTNDCSYGLLVTPGQQPDYYTSAANHVLGGTVMALGTWHHIAMTWNGTTKVGYYDGVADGSAGASIGSEAAKALSIGERNVASAPISFPGTIDELVFYNRVLTATEITQLANP